MKKNITIAALLLFALFIPACTADLDTEPQEQTPVELENDRGDHEGEEQDPSEVRT